MKIVKGPRAEACFHTVALTSALVFLVLAAALSIAGIWANDSRPFATGGVLTALSVVVGMAGGFALPVYSGRHDDCAQVPLPWRARPEDDR